jgi:hypothetical protein
MFWSANGTQAAPSTVGCALSGHDATKQAAADRVKAAWAMQLETKNPPQPEPGGWSLGHFTGSYRALRRIGCSGD